MQTQAKRLKILERLQQFPGTKGPSGPAGWASRPTVMADDVLRLRRQNGLFLLLAFAALVYILFPGHFDSDSGWMYQQSRDVHTINDANSPLLTFLMSMTREFAPGPAILFTAQLAGWMFGLWLVSDALIGAGHVWTGPLCVLALLFPLTSYIFIDVNKDTGMAALGLVLVGLLVRTALRPRRATIYGDLGLAALAVAFLGMRINAFIALAPLVLVFALNRWPALRRFWGRGLLLAAVIAGALISADHAVKYDAIGASRFWGVRQLAMFDIAGVTRYSGEDASSGLFGPDFRADAFRCYTPRWHDPFEWGACKADGARMASLSQTPAGRRAIYRAWFKAIAGHPVSYAHHRLAYFNQFMRIACTGCATPMTTGAIWPRPWEAQPTRITSAEVVLDRLATRVETSDLARGWLWMAALLACGAWSAAILRRNADPTLPLLALGLSASGFAYALAFLAIGVAYSSRYLHWTMMLGILAIAVTCAATADHRGRSRRGTRGESFAPDATAAAPPR